MPDRKSAPFSGILVHQRPDERKISRSVRPVLALSRVFERSARSSDELGARGSPPTSRCPPLAPLAVAKGPRSRTMPSKSAMSETATGLSTRQNRLLVYNRRNALSQSAVSRIRSDRNDSRILWTLWALALLVVDHSARSRSVPLGSRTVRTPERSFLPTLPAPASTPFLPLRISTCRPAACLARTRTWNQAFELYQPHQPLHALAIDPATLTFLVELDVIRREP